MTKSAAMASLVPFLVLMSASLVSCQDSVRLKDRIYGQFPTSKVCFRRTNGSHHFGCTSSVGGDVGVVHLVEGQWDVDWVAEGGPHAPYVPVFTPKHFNRENVIR